VRGQRLLDGVGIGRLGEIVDRAFLYRRDGGGNIAVAGQHDDADVGPCLAQRSNQFQPVAVAQPQVENGEGRRSRGLGQRFGDRPDSRHDEATQLEGTRDAVPESRVVVRDQ
jgi:hypothetical protein